MSCLSTPPRPRYSPGSRIDRSPCGAMRNCSSSSRIRQRSSSEHHALTLSPRKVSSSRSGNDVRRALSPFTFSPSVSSVCSARRRTASIRWRRTAAFKRSFTAGGLSANAVLGSGNAVLGSANAGMSTWYSMRFMGTSALPTILRQCCEKVLLLVRRYFSSVTLLHAAQQLASDQMSNRPVLARLKGSRATQGAYRRKFRPRRPYTGRPASTCAAEKAPLRREEDRLRRRSGERRTRRGRSSLRTDQRWRACSRTRGLRVYRFHQE